MIKITQGGRPFDPKRFAADLTAKALELGMQAIEEKARGAAASIVDPETGRHADVFVDRLPGNSVAIRTSGSPVFARLLERAGVIETRHALASKPWRSVQLIRTDRTLRFARSHG